MNKPIALAVLILSIVNLPALAAGNVVSIRADSWYPMNGEPGATDPGYMIELAEKVFGSAGMTVDYKTMPWARALESVKKGEFDCVVGAYTSDAEGFVFPAEKWGMDSTTAFVKKGDSWTYNGVDSLKTRKTAIIQDYSYGDELDAFIAANPQAFEKLGGDDALTKNIKKLAAGRVNTMLESATVTEATLNKLGMTGVLANAGGTAEAEAMYIACSPADKTRAETLTKLVDEQTKALRSSGDLQKILGKYGLKDWQ